MAFTTKQTLRDVSGITNIEEQRITDFLQGAVYGWCKNHKSDWFSLRDLVGGDNFEWEGTPLMVLYTKHRTAGAKDPVKQAGIDAGWLLKKVIDKDKRAFDTKELQFVRQYSWQRKEKN
ncbi:MAG: hypothetical protein DRQ51_09055 [Gammaproteobacteria bacterium]|nr:MAG: hypothetical protein DRQ51_09055 [Gammaproteobacteria bacterium]